MSNYFNKVPNLEYVSRLPDANISDYIAVKNLFKKGKLREDIFQDTYCILPNIKSKVMIDLITWHLKCTVIPLLTG